MTNDIVAEMCEYANRYAAQFGWIETEATLSAFGIESGDIVSAAAATGFIQHAQTWLRDVVATPTISDYASGNAAMIARDGPARPAPVVIQEPTKPSAHAAIAGLTFLGRVDHRLGLGR
jgi:hypothetical protein